MRRFAAHIGALLAVTLAAGSCTSNDGVTGSTADGPALLRVLLTDAPSDLFASATVEIGPVQIVPLNGDPITLTDEGGTFDLLDLQNGVTATLAELEIEAGVYSQLRLIVESATIELADGVEFTDGTTSRELFVPSGFETGIKINLDAADGDPSTPGIEIVPGETEIVVDFDVCQNFVILGNPDTPAGLQGVLFTPLLRAVSREAAAGISGTVTLEGSGDPVEGATVVARHLDEGTLDDGQTDEATARTAADGSYTIRFLVPGRYEVSVEEFSADPQEVEVGPGEDLTGVDFVGTPTDS